MADKSAAIGKAVPQTATAGPAGRCPIAPRLKGPEECVYNGGRREPIHLASGTFGDATESYLHTSDHIRDHGDA